ncbi:hypothetical protein CP10139811_0586 [Chlamydia ibidis]|uniref:Uncharacterized protein n=2 Tax=Chlamydia ibidis TaxID=1405396 RepID=S7KER8_9CHLA|nr:hypothetical protein [Chlamydia ibidis]EPP34676.1 hypothetical protein CP10139811_0586 [Chlamydia ibidis]EQM62492.1 hypothetical protein H359_0966 [Chlamydia ibidis 10-1398/6]
MQDKLVEQLSQEAELLKKLRDKALAQSEQRKRDLWLEELLAMPEVTSCSQVDVNSLDTPEVFLEVAKRIIERGV